jgi:hypothetical protein
MPRTPLFSFKTEVFFRRAFCVPSGVRRIVGNPTQEKSPGCRFIPYAVERKIPVKPPACARTANLPFCRPPGVGPATFNSDVDKPPTCSFWRRAVMKLTKFIYLAVAINRALDAGRYVSSNEIRQHITRGNIFSFLQSTLGADLDLTFFSQDEKLALQEEWRALEFATRGSKKIGAEKHGLCLLMGYTLLSLQKMRVADTPKRSIAEASETDFRTTQKYKELQMSMLKQQAEINSLKWHIQSMGKGANAPKDAARRG